MEKSSEIIHEKFQIILNEITLDESVRMECQKVVDLLKTVFLSLKLAIQVVPFGSFSRMTEIKGSDFDIIIPLITVDLRKFSIDSTINFIINGLKKELPEKEFEVNIDFPVIVLKKKGLNMKFDLLPCSIVEPLIGNNNEMLIPISGRNLVRINPDFQSRYIAGLIGRNGYGARNDSDIIYGSIVDTSKLFKYWKSCFSINMDIPSFYMEMILSSSWSGLKKNSLQYNFSYSFAALQKLIREKIVIDPYSRHTNTNPTHPFITDEKTIDLIGYTFNNAKKAMELEYSGDSQNAIKFWNIVFNNRFS